MSGVDVRRFRREDLPALMEVRRSSIKDVASRDYTPAQIEAWVQTSQNPETQARRFGDESITWIAVTGGAVAGFTNLAVNGTVDCLYVHANHQGRGVATALLAALEAEARAQDLTRLHSEVSITARPFFERRGFAVVTPQRVTVNGETYDNFKMEKLL